MKRLVWLFCYVLLCFLVGSVAALGVAMAYSPPQKSGESGLYNQTNSPIAFTYQGQLRDGNDPVNGSFDFQFALYSAQTGGEKLGAIEMKNMALTNGMFSLKLDFGRAAVEAKESWLEIGVRSAGSTEPHTVLFPRQKLTPTPYAIFAQHEQWSLIGVPVGFVDRDIIQEGANAVIEPESSTKPKGVESSKPEVTAAAAPQGTPGFIARFDLSGNPTVNSVMFDNGTNIGIGTGTPGQKFTLGSGNILLPNGNGGQDGNLYLGGITDRGQVGMRLFGGLPSPLPAGSIDVRTTNLADGLIFRVDNVLGAIERMRITASGNVGIGTTTPQAKFDVAGMVKANVVQITGGSDLAEPFVITAAEIIKPGMVVAIDPERLGHLRIADKAYDRAVAGIVSGANGINPGLTMKQEGTAADGSLLVALTGRVYCWADASYGPIEPGDLLTTSDTPGHATKVTDHTKAQGAIIGKAMTELKQGKGLVLVLVTLQ